MVMPPDALGRKGVITMTTITVNDEIDWKSHLGSYLLSYRQQNTTFYLSLCCKRYFSSSFYPGYLFLLQFSSFDSGHHPSLFYRGVCRGRNIPVVMTRKTSIVITAHAPYTTITLTTQFLPGHSKLEWILQNSLTQGFCFHTNEPALATGGKLFFI